MSGQCLTACCLSRFSSSRQRKILHIVNACFVGKYGLADYTLSFSRALCEFARVEIITSKSFSYPNVRFGGVVTRLFSRSVFYPIDLFRFVVYVLRIRPDIVVLQSKLKVAFLDGLVARFISLFGVRTVCVVHDVLPHYPKKWSQAEYGFLYRSFDRLVAHSVGAERRLRELGISAPILVIPHGLYDIYKLENLSQGAARSQIPGLSSDDFVGLFFGVVDERKGIGELAKLMSDESLPTDFKLLVAGGNCVPASNSSLQSEISRMINQSNCVARLERIPFDEVERYFAACDFVLVPYKEGTTSGVLKLALAFGKPVIATDVGDLSETVTEEVGVLIRHDRISEELSSAVWKMKQMGATLDVGKVMGEGAFSWQLIAERFHRFVSEDIGGEPRL